MTETVAADRTTPSTARLVVALVVAAAMVVAACVCIGLMFAVLMDRVDGSGPEPSWAIAVVALATAVCLFAGTGPAAYLISRRRWTLAFPVILVGIWVAGIGIAAWT